MTKSILKCILFISLIIIPHFLSAQNIKRKGELGIRGIEINDSIAQARGLKYNYGYLINSISSNSTAISLKLRKNDVIIKVNDNEIRSIKSLNTATSGLREGDDVAVTIVRGKKIKRLRSRVLPKAFETAENADIIYDEIAFEDGYLRTITNKPRKHDKMPAILFIPGYNCFSQDNMHPLISYTKLIKGFTDNGFVVQRIEKSGMGDNMNTPVCNLTGFNYETRIFEKGYEKLKSLSFVDTNNIFIFGHSLGGCIAPLVAQKYNPKGVIVYGTLYTPWFEFLMRMLRFQNTLFGNDYIDNEEDMRIYHSLLYEHYILKKTPQELAINNDFRRLLERDFQYNGSDQIFQRHFTFWQELNDANLTKAWKNNESYVLSIYGGADVHAVDPREHKKITDIVNYYHKNHGSFILLEKTNHSFIKVGNYEDEVRIGNDWDYIRNNFNYDIINFTNKWMKDIISK